MMGGCFKISGNMPNKKPPSVLDERGPGISRRGEDKNVAAACTIIAKTKVMRTTGKAETTTAKSIILSGINGKRHGA
jgi:hypothetical protein